jgi:hypothetical protein
MRALVQELLNSIVLCATVLCATLLCLHRLVATFSRLPKPCCIRAISMTS